MNYHFNDTQIFSQGDIVTYCNPHDGSEGNGVVLSSKKLQFFRPGRVIICPLTLGERSEGAWGVRIWNGVVDPHSIQTVGTKYWRVKLSPEMGRLGEKGINRIIRKFSEIIYPTKSDFNTHMRQNSLFKYGEIRWYDDLPFTEVSGFKPHPVLCISCPDAKGRVMVLLRSSHMESFNELFACKDPSERNDTFYNCADIHLINQEAAGRLFARVSKKTLSAVTMTVLAGMDQKVYREVRNAVRPIAATKTAGLPAPSIEH